MTTYPLSAIKVLDISQGIAGPFCGAQLARYGADVIKIEPPAGDWSRGVGQTAGGHSALSAVYNVGKRAMILDFKVKIIFKYLFINFSYLFCLIVISINQVR